MGYGILIGRGLTKYYCIHLSPKFNFMDLINYDYRKHNTLFWHIISTVRGVIKSPNIAC